MSGSRSAEEECAASLTVDVGEGEVIEYTKRTPSFFRPYRTCREAVDRRRPTTVVGTRLQGWMYDEPTSRQLR